MVAATWEGMQWKPNEKKMVANIKQANIDYHVVAHVPCNTTFRVLIVQKFIKSAVGNDYKEYHSAVHLKYLEQPIRIT